MVSAESRPKTYRLVCVEISQGGWGGGRRGDGEAARPTPSDCPPFQPQRPHREEVSALWKLSSLGTAVLNLDLPLLVACVRWGVRCKQPACCPGLNSKESSEKLLKLQLFHPSVSRDQATWDHNFPLYSLSIQRNSFGFSKWFLRTGQRKKMFWFTCMYSLRFTQPGLFCWALKAAC